MHGAPVYACDAWPIAPGTLIRVYEEPNGLIFREYDTDSDGKADYGTAHRVREGQETPFPLFYGIGQDDPDSPRRPFKTFQIYIDQGGQGRCQDIVLYSGAPRYRL